MRVLLISSIPFSYSPPIPFLPQSFNLNIFHPPSHSIFYHTTIQDMRVLVISSITLQAGQQFCGINAVFYYSTMIFKGAITGTYHAHVCLCTRSYALLHSFFLNFSFIMCVLYFDVSNHNLYEQKNNTSYLILITIRSDSRNSISCVCECSSNIHCTPTNEQNSKKDFNTNFNRRNDYFYGVYYSVTIRYARPNPETLSFYCVLFVFYYISCILFQFHSSFFIYLIFLIQIIFFYYFSSCSFSLSLLIYFSFSFFFRIVAESDVSLCRNVLRCFLR